MIIDRAKGTFKGTMRELEELRREHRGEIFLNSASRARVFMTTEVTVNQHGQIFIIDKWSGKYIRVGDCLGGTWA